MNTNIRRNRRGIGMIWVVIGLMSALGIASLAVDFGRVQLAKTSLRCAVDAAARYGATGLNDGTYATKAIDAANDNLVEGLPVNLTSGDLVRGYYNTATRTFTPNGSPINALQVSCTRSGNSAIPLLFARNFGMSEVRISASSIALATTRSTYFTGLSGIDTDHNTFVGSYNSASTTSPTHANHNGGAGMGSNGSVTWDSGTLSGSLLLGPAGSQSGIGFIDGGAVVNSSTAIPTPSEPAWSPGVNPGSIAQNYTVSGNTTLQAGTYWFTSLTVTGNLTFNGSATVYVNGNVNLSGSINGYSNIPGNLTIYQIGNNRTFGDATANNVVVRAVIYAPRSDFEVKNNLYFCGRAVFRTITTKNNADFYCDEALGGGGGLPAISVVR